jgi:hypothetical protein
MADTFASFARKVDQFGKALEDDAISHALGKMAKAEAAKAASADLGGDPKFSGWAPALDTRYDIVGPGRISFHPSKRSAGPWTVAQEGRNSAAGPSIGGKGRGGKRKRYNGRTRGKGTSDDALRAIAREAPKVADKEVAKAVRKFFD